nr:hypothetical protein GCM10020092_067100 [Actinoplanes digitatis]
MPAVTPSSTVEIVHDVADGVLVECIEDGGQLRVRVVSSGYHQDWQVQFPKGIRERGSRYVVTGVRPATRGGFYRAYGEIRRLL